MPQIKLETRITAPLERVFDLSRSVDLHIASTGSTREMAVAGTTSGLMKLGDEVTWEATHFGIRQRLTSRIAEYDRPNHFRDSMVRGAFKRFDHDHDFVSQESGTLVRDRLDFESPLGLIGQLADTIFLMRYMEQFLFLRLQAIKSVAESDEWKQYLEKA